MLGKSVRVWISNGFNNNGKEEGYRWHVSSKSGYEGDITTYQISAPIQGGSGGPLFDENFIGTSSD